MNCINNLIIFYRHFESSLSSSTFYKILDIWSLIQYTFCSIKSKSHIQNSEYGIMTQIALNLSFFNNFTEMVSAKVSIIISFGRICKWYESNVIQIITSCTLSLVVHQIIFEYYRPYFWLWLNRINISKTWWRPQNILTSPTWLHLQKKTLR